MKNYFDANQKMWNQRTETHLTSEFYDLENFRLGGSSLKPIELELLGDVAGLSVLHPQCHFGQDTLSLARLGAQVTGYDLSDRAIREARKLATDLGIDARFVQGNVLEMDQHLEETYDLVFCSYGCIGWLPDLRPWGQQIARRLKPGGRFILAEFHPAVWMFDDDLREITYSYFNREPIVETTDITYTENATEQDITSYSWNHALADVFQALLEAGLQVETFREYDYSPWNCFQNTVPSPGGWQIEGLAGKLPIVFGLVVRK